MKRHFGLTVVVALLVSQILGSDVAFAESYNFDQFRTSSLLKGKTHLPAFNGRDKKYKDYRTRIRDGLNEGPNFAGHYSVVQIGCGTGCSFAFIADNQTGQVFDFPRGGEDNAYMQLLFKSGSRLIAAQWGNYDSNACYIEYFEWDGRTAASLDKSQIGDLEACYKDIGEAISKEQ